MSEGELVDDLMGLFNDLPSEASTIITGSTRGSVAQETISRLSSEQKIRIALVRHGVSLEVLNARAEKQNGRQTAMEERCAKIQEGESAHGCAHLDTLAERVSRWVVAQSITMAILAAVGIAGLGFAVWAIQEIVSH